jgi:hypothetical protein
MGPAASPMSEMVPNTPIAAPRPRVEAISALAHRAIAAMPRPRSGATARTPRGFRSERSSEAQLFRTIAIGVAEPDNLGVDRQEAESAVAMRIGGVATNPARSSRTRRPRRPTLLPVVPRGDRHRAATPRQGARPVRSRRREDTSPLLKLLLGLVLIAAALKASGVEVVEMQVVGGRL